MADRAPSPESAVINSPPVRLGVVTGTLLIVANMIGVGVFTTTGYMVAAVPSPTAVLVAWLIGGLAALCGALTYAELGAALPRNGGEYALLTRIYHPAVGFVAGWVSLIVGFAAPLASYALAFESYLEAVVPQVAPKWTGLTLIAVCAALHALHVGWGSRLHNVFTLAKVALIVLFIAAGMMSGEPALLDVPTEKTLSESIMSPPFAVQLVFVSFAYGGWNAAAYLAGEFRRPDKDIVRSVVAGVVIVTFLYLGLNYVFLTAAPLGDLADKLDVGYVAAVHLFGEQGGRAISLLIVAGLVSTVSGNLMAGPRIYEAMGEDYARLRFLNLRRGRGGPVVAIGLQAGVAALMVQVSTPDQLIRYVGLTLSLFAAATVLGAIVLRRREPDLPRPYRTWGYPVTPLLFVLLEAWMVWFMVQSDWKTAAWSAGTIAVGLLLYWVVRER
ncbi:MAG: amino acid permease [Planctomycetaceae bacterium]|nr:amino acid permease [Planctomycetaceae bacterium]